MVKLDCSRFVSAKIISLVQKRILYFFRGSNQVTTDFKTGLFLTT